MSEMEGKYSKDMIEAFVAKPEKTFWYQNAFSKFNINGVDSMKWNWSWWAFFGGAGFLLYRKQYIPALILFVASIVLGFIPFVPLIISILAGGYSTYFVYKGYKTKLGEVEANIDDEVKRVDTMKQIGGYHSWVVWVYSIFIAFVIVGVIATMTMAAAVSGY